MTKAQKALWKHLCFFKFMEHMHEAFLIKSFYELLARITYTNYYQKLVWNLIISLRFNLRSSRHKIVAKTLNWIRQIFVSCWLEEQQTDFPNPDKLLIYNDPIRNRHVLSPLKSAALLNHRNGNVHPKTFK